MCWAVFNLWFEVVLCHNKSKLADAPFHDMSKCAPEAYDFVESFTECLLVAQKITKQDRA